MGIGGRCRNIPENELYAESSLSAQQPNHLWFLSSYFLATPPSMLCALATVLRREPFVFIRVNSDFIDHLANAQGYGLTGKHSSNSLTDSAVSSNLLEANFLHTLRSLFCLFFFFFLANLDNTLHPFSWRPVSTAGLRGEAFNKAGCLLPSSGYQPALQGRESRGCRRPQRDICANVFRLEKKEKK